ncbi:hypothetical protein PUN28_013994 [Cardiocondyla obscurior]|uniref:Uncharacterized protein n=1 Tax=Cardiocondyla obscurior TaxID=286306 RepID=A0AAW2F4A5_9HYME
MNYEGIVGMPFAFHKSGISLESFEFSNDSTWLMAFLLSRLRYAAMESNNLRSIKKSRARRNRKIRELRELVRSFFIQFLFAAASREVSPEPPKRRSERSWSPLPFAPPNSPCNGECPEVEKGSPPRTPSPSRSETPTPSEPESEQFRPTFSSYTLDKSLDSTEPSPGAAPRACSSPIPSPTLYPGEPEEVGFFAKDETVSWQESDSPDHSPSPSPSVQFLEEQEEPRAVVDPLLELLRRTCTPWTDPVPERAYTIGPDYFDPEKIRRKARRATPN